tara:strand:+ start:637 stop:1116 length:480 start_codon:yes stop_codon:yes gene_type:complete
MGTKKKYFYFFIITLTIFILDRISKLYILNVAEKFGEVDIKINSFLNFILIWNTGIGFGLFSSDQSFLYNVFTLIIILVNIIILYLAHKSDKLISFFYVVVFGGSLGNLFDRIYYSAVPDFIDINFNGYHWFIFNVADIFITIGIICLIVTEILGYKRN